jgi:hypothetical protein
MASGVLLFLGRLLLLSSSLRSQESCTREVVHLLCFLELFELPVSVAFKFLASGALMLNV